MASSHSNGSFIQQSRNADNPPQAPGSELSPMVSVPNHNMMVRIAVLETELEHHRLEKAEAEVAVRYLARLSSCNNVEASSQTKPGNLKLELNLRTVNEENLQLKAKIEQALAIIVHLVAKIGSHPSTTATDFPDHSPASSRFEDLINLEDLAPECSVSDASPETTLLESASDSIAEIDGEDGRGEDSSVCEKNFQSPQESFISDFTNSTSMVHFKDRSKSSKSSNNANLFAKVEIKEVQSVHTNADTDQGTTNRSLPSTKSRYPLLKLPSTVEPGRDWTSDSSNDDSLLPSSPVSSHKSSEGNIKRDEAFYPVCAPRFNPRTLYEPRWTHFNGFDSAAERAAAMKIYSSNVGPDNLRLPALFRFGLRFDPDNSRPDIFRTVIISGLPPTITMIRLLDRVRGGMVVEANILDTMSIIGGKSALVTFQKEPAAFAYTAFARKHPIIYDGVVVKVNVVSTPTWPMPINVFNSIGKSNATRYFEVHNLPQQVHPETVAKHLEICHDTMFQAIEEITLKWGILGLRFYSVKYAVAAAATLIRIGVYRHCSIKWLPDPCSRPLETLLDEEPKATEDNQDYIEAPAVDQSHTADSSAVRLDKPTFANRPNICFERSFKTKDAPNDDFDAPPISGGCLSIAHHTQ